MKYSRNTSELSSTRCAGESSKVHSY